MKRSLLSLLITSSCVGMYSIFASASSMAQSVSQQFDKDHPPDMPDVKVVGHILKPKALELTDDRLAQLRLPAGFEVTVFAEDLIDPRMLAVSEDGAVFVTRRATGDLIRVTDEDGDGVSDTQELVAHRPGLHGIAINGTELYLVTVKELYKTTIQPNGELAPLQLLLNDLPDGGQHPNRTLAIGPDGLLYLSVGSTCNACAETNPENATILQIAPDGSSRTIFASGLRNTIGFGFAPGSDALYGMDHGIDWLGDNEQREELNHIVKYGHYGWPYIYGDGHYNPADKPPAGLSWSDWAEESINPVGLYTPHAAPMQMVFYTGEQFPENFRGDAFVAMRGSWNRKPPSGYEVVRIDFDGGKPVAFEPFITHFLMMDNGTWGHVGRLAGMAQTADGALLLSDDENGVIYRIAYTGESPDGESPAALQPTNADGANIQMTNTPAVPPAQSTSSQLAIDTLGGDAAALEATSPAFDPGAAIPDMFAAEHDNISPPLEWQPGPDTTKSYAVIMEDPDAPQASPFVHWLVYNIPAEITALDKALPPEPALEKPDGALQGLNDRGSIGYFGPRPPAGDPPHHYHFEVFALDTKLELNHVATRAELVEAMTGHVVASGSFIGVYQR